MNQSKNNAIQGLRFWAITLIIASHCGFLAQGGLGNNIFFAMSGFFVCQPFFQEDFEHKYFHIGQFFKYYVKRFIRIIPACWLCMFFASWGLSFFDFRDFTTENSLLLNMFFIKSKNHLWFLQQEIVFYLVAPFLILIIGLFKMLLKKLGLKELALNICTFIFLNVFVAITYVYVPKTGLLLQANGGEAPFRIWLFIIGMSFAYLFKIVKPLLQRLSIEHLKTLSVIGSAYICLCLVLSILSSEQILSRFDEGFKGFFIGWEHPLLITYLASFAIMILCLLPAKNWISKFLGNPLFTLIGNVSFSMYLLHYMLMLHFMELSPYRILVVAYILSLTMSIAIYNFVEQPLIKKTKEYLH